MTMVTIKRIPTFFHEFKGRELPVVDRNTYRLEVGGAVDEPLVLSLDELEQTLPVTSGRRRFYCVNGWSLEALWHGVSIAALLERVGPDPDAPYIRSTSIGGYEDTSSIRELVDGEAMIVTRMNGEPLSPERGFPARLMLFDRYQFRGVKALAQLLVVRDYRPGAWVKYGYSDATIQAYPHLAIDTGEELMPDAQIVTRSFAPRSARSVDA
jgi:DMSO/TMAO reductase YedYZ molybdopterin-dependent catalytic subunit